LVRRYVEANRAGWLRSDGKHGGRAAFYFAFLYKATGEEQWAQWATDRLRTTGQWLDSHPDEAIGFPWLPPVCMAYAWIRDSQSLEANDHEVIRRTLLAAARRHWPLRERGAMNRSTGSALGYSLLAKLFPDEADVPTWRQYAESVWNDWYEQADTDEDSLHYNALWWEYVITYARENGLENMYARPEIRRLIERYREQVSPLGPKPSFVSAAIQSSSGPNACRINGTYSETASPGKPINVRSCANYGVSGEYLKSGPVSAFHAKPANDTIPQVSPTTTPKSMIPRQGCEQNETRTIKMMIPTVRLIELICTRRRAWK